jgi:predicted nicotinamide N-methyase
LEQVADVNKLIDSITDEEFNQDERLPYWAELWPSAQALANFILQNKYLFEGKKILELGCGLGLVGIAATIAEAKVLFTDY